MGLREEETKGRERTHRTIQIRYIYATFIIARDAEERGREKLFREPKEDI